MSKQYPGGLITKTPVTPTQVSASGVWTLDQQAYWQKIGQWPYPGYVVSRSLRFNSADSAYLNRTPASAGSRTTWTWSAWVKRGQLGALQAIFTAGGDAPNPRGLIEFEAADTIRVGFNDGTSWYLASTSAVFRDPSAWYHVVVALDLTNGTNANRVKLYVNNVLQSFASTPTWPTTDQVFNNNVVHRLGAYYGATPSNFLSAYMTEVNFIDGQALTPSSFGETNADTGVWQPKAYAGSYGTNGFYLNFSDNSNTTAATLGKDYSGNGNNWTPNNFSVTAGSGNDSLVDSPTSYGTDTGVGGTVRGNYATLNPLIKPVGTVAYSNGNLDATNSTSNWNAIGGTIGISTGKWYWEYISGGQNTFFGIQVPSINFSSGNPQDANAAAGSVLLCDDNQYQIDYNARVAYTSTSHPSGTVVGVAVDMDAGTIVFYLNGTSQGSITWTSSAAYGKTVIPMAIAYNSGYVTTANFGQRPFAYTAPSGYKALCTQNLPTPTIGATSTTLANLYFNPVTYTGTGATQTVTVGFETGLLWGKERSGADRHWLADQVRGLKTTGYYLLSSNNTDADTSSAAPDGVTAITSTGFTLGANTSNTDGNWSFEINQSGSTYVAWNWKANGSGSTNTAGSITSTVSANTTSGFSVVTWTCPSSGAGYTVGHGLGTTPAMIIVKERSATNDWYVWHQSFASTTQGNLRLNTTAAVGTSSLIWNNTAPTSTVFSTYVGTTLAASGTGVAYCFAEVAGYSKFGSYTGNASLDGPFLYCGFRPAYVLIKRTDISGTWSVFDNKRPTYNLVNLLLQPNLTNAEYTSSNDYQVDFVSNGVKVRASSGINDSGNTYIFAAFAESPFKYSLAR